MEIFPQSTVQTLVDQLMQSLNANMPLIIALIGLVLAVAYTVGFFDKSTKRIAYDSDFEDDYKEQSYRNRGQS